MKCLLLSALCLSGLAACSSTTQVSLDYVPGPGHVRPGQAEFSTRQFVDRRDMEPTSLGTVRTQIGTPVEYVQTRIPVDEVVTHAFAHALDARGMLTSPGNARYIITGEVLDLYCQLLVRPYGYARLRVSVVAAGSGEVLHSRVHTGERQSTAFIPGSGSPVPLLNGLTSGALQDAVDRSLDDPEMRSRLSPAPGMSGMQ